MALGFYFDMTVCIGCHTCQIACRDKNNLYNVGEIYRAVKVFEGGKYPSPYYYHLSIACNHCSDAKCVEGCPTMAMHYDGDGTVQHDDDKCIGCRYCTWNCPYGAPQFLEEKGVVGKCDSCKDLRDQGENPACVDACLMRCIKFGDLDELRAEYGPDLVQELPILPSESMTHPSLLIHPRTSAENTDAKERLY